MWGHAGFFFSFIMCVPVHVCTCACHSMYMEVRGQVTIVDSVCLLYWLSHQAWQLSHHPAEPSCWPCAGFFFGICAAEGWWKVIESCIFFFDIPGQEGYGELSWLSNCKQVYFNDLFVLIQNCKRNGGLPLSHCFLDARNQTDLRDDLSDWEACQEDAQGHHVRDSSEAGPCQNRVKHTETILRNTKRPSASIYGEREPMPWSLQGQRRASGGYHHLTMRSIFCLPWADPACGGFIKVDDSRPASPRSQEVLYSYFSMESAGYWLLEREANF